MARFSDLPVEIAEHVVIVAARDNAMDTAWLATFARTSQAICEVVRPILYEHVAIRTRRTCSRLARSCATPRDAARFRVTRSLLLTIADEHVGSSTAVDRITAAFEHVAAYGGPFGLFSRFVYTRPAFRPAVIALTTPCTLTTLLSAPFADVLAGRLTHLHVFLDRASSGLELVRFGVHATDVIVELPAAIDGATMVAVARVWLALSTLRRLVIRKGSSDMDGPWEEAVGMLRDFVTVWNDKRVWIDYDATFKPCAAPRTTLDTTRWGTGRATRCVLYMN